MKDIMKYKGFIGSVHFYANDEVFHGKIQGVSDLITFEGKSVEELKRAFHDAVDDYVALCKEAGKEPMKSCKGSFNVRISPALHIEAVMVAKERGITLNQLVKTALEEKIIEEEKRCA